MPVSSWTGAVRRRYHVVRSGGYVLQEIGRHPVSVAASDRAVDVHAVIQRVVLEGDSVPARVEGHGAGIIPVRLAVPVGLDVRARFLFSRAGVKIAADVAHGKDEHHVVQIDVPVPFGAKLVPCRLAEVRPVLLLRAFPAEIRRAENAAEAGPAVPHRAAQAFRSEQLSEGGPLVLYHVFRKSGVQIAVIAPYGQLSARQTVLSGLDLIDVHAYVHGKYPPVQLLIKPCGPRSERHVSPRVFSAVRRSAVLPVPFPVLFRFSVF